MGLFKQRLNTLQCIYKYEGVKGVVAKINQVSQTKTHSAVVSTLDINSLNHSRLKQLENYVMNDFLRAYRKVSEQSDYVPKAVDSLANEKLPLKIIAYYLPQFHPFKENDEWWGTGFTEWTNVSKARPQYLGHHQPRLPGELGFYDLRLPVVMKQQIDLAKQYGIKAFCFHHYWFGGKRLMETPVNNFLNDSSLNIDFCLCWANENWSRRWDGSENDILIAQQHSAEDDIAFLDDIMPALKDERYIKIDGKPLLIVYRASLLPNAQETAERWRNHAIKCGIPGLYLVVARSFDIKDPRPYGFDASVEFPPHQVSVAEITHTLPIINKQYEGKIYDYPSLAEKYGQIFEKEFVNFKSVMPSWDNEARKPSRGHTFHGAKPEVYAKWLSVAAETTLRHKNAEERLLFINAWNEWAEGAHLEPDRHYGYAYLHATANVLRNLKYKNKLDTFLEKINKEFRPKKSAVAILHVYYEDVAFEILNKYLINLNDNIDLIITLRQDYSEKFVNTVKNKFPQVYFIAVENRGRDIKPFIETLYTLRQFGYKYACKIHTKKSLHMKDGDAWRENMINDLIGNNNSVMSILNLFDINKNLGVYAPRNSLTDLSIPDVNVDNRKWLNILFSRLNLSQRSVSYDTFFPAGSMYWFRVSAIEGLTELVNTDEFELEAGQLDGTLAHSLERTIGLIVEKNGYTIVENKG